MSMSNKIKGQDKWGNICHIQKSSSSIIRNQKEKVKCPTEKWTKVIKRSIIKKKVKMANTKSSIKAMQTKTRYSYIFTCRTGKDFKK